ncbi:hypothetical protein E3W66_03350 [Gammaproteobacteria bacterium LSUCC0057]|uniref:Uncharacterized protein n=1 Tax=Gammaproteobacteria bacterium LSUCC0057 TaxID=2559237 RepID=A0A4Y8UJW0_9GAMM|nr:hypothetical protein E3W66_03350 [Gammaproteobacteria bacterium LSUCC0057]
MMTVIEYALVLSGVITVCTSLFYYYRRTGDKFRIGQLLRGRLELDGREFLFNRIGLYLLAMGVMIRYVNQIFLG